MIRRNSAWDLMRPLGLFLFSMLWLEGIYRIFCVERFFDRGLLYILLFSFPIALVCTLLSSLGGRRANRVVMGVLLGLMTLWYMVQAVYYTLFHTVLVTKSFNMAGQALGSYWRETLAGILRTLPALLLLALPLVFFFLAGKRAALTVRADGRELLIVVAAAVVFQVLALLSLNLPSSGVMTTRSLYRQSFLPDLCVSRFGVATTLRLDIAQSLFGLEEPDEEVLLPDPQPGGDGSASTGDGSQSTGGDVSAEQPVVYEPNVMDIDFDTLIANETDQTLLGMHQYFSTREPTLKNEYTGLFEGKNLIFITAEAFWIGAVSEKYTPTLYKLANEGFVFENFYNPLWWYSTVDGEYAACTGLIPSNQVNASFKYTGKHENSMYFCMGNMLRAQGYPTTAYHNNGYKYYDRNLSHPNMGYDFYGVGNGLEMTPTWPESDLEMMEKTIPQALAGEKPFHNYYMTVSGHMLYTFTGNSMSYKHREEVADMDASDSAKAYMACNIELDRALEYVLQELEAAGELENTVICMSGDHYPYGLDGTGAIDELTHEGVEADLIEKYRSTLILWSGSMEEPVIVDKPCSSIDILPTLLNLFGLEYDSRLIIGRDILSTAPGLVPTNRRCFVSELGKYYSDTDTFIPNEGVEVSDDYVSQTYQEMQRMFTYSERILFNDYYRVLGLEPPAA